MAVNLKGTMHVLRAASAAMSGQDPLPEYQSRRGGTRALGRGSIVCLSSLSGYVGMPFNMDYSASKHAVIGMVRTAGSEAPCSPPPFPYPLSKLLCV